MLKLFGLFLFFTTLVMSSEEKYHLAKVENNLQKFCDITNLFSEFLEDFNDRHLGNSEWGKMLGYEEIKPLIRDSDNSRGLKKMSMAMMPLVFHVGATSTWMILTSIMAVKSVTIGLILLVFKIAVSSAKIASFFTLLKSKHHEHHHEYAWTPHGYDTDRTFKEIPTHGDWNSYIPQWSPSEPHTGYQTVPSYKENHMNYADVEYEDANYAKPHADKKTNSY